MRQDIINKPRGRAVSHRMTGIEYFHKSGVNLGFDLLSFWQWFGSNLNTSAFRGNLAEYLVKQATGAQGNPKVQTAEDVRATWDDCDLYLNGNGIEVKCAASLQDFGWTRIKHSRPIFEIRQTASWNKADGTRSKDVKRHSKVYVFSVLKEKDSEKLDPLNVSQWEFWIVPTNILDKYYPTQKTISLAKIKGLSETIYATFDNLKDAVTQALSKV